MRSNDDEAQAVVVDVLADYGGAAHFLDPTLLWPAQRPGEVIWRPS